jgi:hypothetical protein
MSRCVKNNCNSCTKRLFNQGTELETPWGWWTFRTLLRIKIQSCDICETKTLYGLLNTVMLVSSCGIVVELQWLECAVMCQPFCGKWYKEMDSKSVRVFDWSNQCSRCLWYFFQIHSRTNKLWQLKQCHCRIDFKSCKVDVLYTECSFTV